MKYFLPILGLFLSMTLFQACSEPTIVGSDLLAQDQIDIGFTDTFSLQATVIPTDSVRTFSPDFAAQLIAYLVGDMDDPIFGRSTARVNAEFLPGTEEPDFTDAVLDSVVLVLPYYAFGQYGDTTEFYEVEVFRLNERLDGAAAIYSNTTVPVGSLLGTTGMFMPRPSDSITIVEHGDPDETFRLPAQLRIRLDDAFGEEILAEPIETFEDDSIFLERYPGIHLAPATTNAGMNSFNLRTGSAAVIIYYHVDDDFEAYSFPFNTNSVRFTTYEHDYSGSVAEAFIENPELSDSLLFLQGMSGLSITLEIPNTDFFLDKVINKAVLELTDAELPEDMNTPFDPATQLIVSEVTDTGLVIIQDVQFAFDRNDIVTVFGGNLDESDGPGKYEMNLSAHLRKMSRGEVSNKIQVTILARSEQAFRVVLSGPENSSHPAILKVNFTNL